MAKLSGAPPQGTANGSAGAHSKVTIYYNPKCRKSREALQIIKEKGIDPEIRNYMEEPPSKTELAEVLRKMGRRPRDIFRKSEPLYKDLGLKNKDLTDDELLTYLNEYPILIERPIVVKGQRAVLGRPPEDVRRIIWQAYGPAGNMGRTLVVTSGPTREFFDPIRFLSNPSTGRMGHSIAAAGVRRGLDVVFISGPVMPEFLTVEGAKNIAVISTDDMLAAVADNLCPGAILVMAAAPADYRPAIKSPVKIKKTENPQINLVPNPDILKEMAKKNKSLTPHAILVGFAAETHETEKYALGKLRDKELDMIFLNDVSRQGAGFASATNEFTVFYRDGRREELANAAKEALGEKIVDSVLAYAQV